MKAKHTEQGVLLCNPWIHDFAAYDLWMRPLGLLTLAELLLRKGIPVTLLDLMDRRHPAWADVSDPKPKKNGTGAFFKKQIPKPPVVRHVPRRFSRYGAPIERVKARLKELSQRSQRGQRNQRGRSPFQAILLTSSMTYWYPGVMETAAMLRHFFPNTPLMLGGNYASLLPKHAEAKINPDLLYSPTISLHEGTGFEGTGFEGTGFEGMDSEGAGSSLENLLGISLDQLPQGVPTSLGHAMELYQNWTSYPLLTSVGCPFKCHFCATPMLNPTFRRRPHEEVVHEIIEAHQSRGARNFVFYDDALFFQPDKHIKPLLEGLLKWGGTNGQRQGLRQGLRQRLRLHTPNGLSPRFIDAELAQLMKKTGFFRPRLSLESSDPKRKSAMSHKVTLHEYHRAISHLLSAGFLPGQPITYVLMGLKGQKEKEIAASIKTALNAGSAVTVASLSPIPGTQAHKEWGLPEDMDPLLLSNTVFLAHTAPNLSNLLPRGYSVGKASVGAASVAQNSETAMGESVDKMRRLTKVSR